MENVAKRLAAARASAKLAEVFDTRPTKAEFEMNCVMTSMLYSMV